MVTLEHDKFGGRLRVLPTCMDGFLLDTMLALSKLRTKEPALEKALRSLEDGVDVVIVDCPPSLGTTMDTALYYARRRDGEEQGVSGVIIPVQAEDSSAKAFMMLEDQISALEEDLALEVDYLGFVVNMYEARRGTVATTSLERWEKMEHPPLLAVIGDLTEQREAVRMQQPLLSRSRSRSLGTEQPPRSSRLITQLSPAEARRASPPHRRGPVITQLSPLRHRRRSPARPRRPLTPCSFRPCGIPSLIFRSWQTSSERSSMPISGSCWRTSSSTDNGALASTWCPGQTRGTTHVQHPQTPAKIGTMGQVVRRDHSLEGWSLSQ
ncbi:ParA family protein [Streptomyces sp. NPDC006512]|uniref:ParA family protein n=1 Tax=Streptomyces sp. NPDC006512 TaxID=3154307 RepID=UPI0033A8D149